MAAPAGRNGSWAASVRRGAADWRIDAVESREEVVSGGEEYIYRGNKQF